MNRRIVYITNSNPQYKFSMVLLLRLKAWSDVEITELRIKQHFYWKFHLCFHFPKWYYTGNAGSCMDLEREGRWNRWECTFQQTRLKITCIMTFMRKHNTHLFFTDFFFTFILGAALSYSHFFSHPSLDTGWVPHCSLQGVKNVLYLLGWMKEHLWNYFSSVWGLV